ncbi:MAG TPA: hypothetical protein VG269_02405 [Tepidisphaeraceae bacterium]|jgi:hypothetical protein|nr:hypothetical protein [Tepidisphaeraceae bacterium]
MSRLDQHVGAVRNKMALDTLLRALALAGIVFGSVVLLAVLVDRILQWHLPRPRVLFWVGFAVTVVAPAVYAYLRRPTARQAAVAIDHTLGLKEKFSTALYVRPSKDPFAAAAVRDAEKTAESVNLHQRFPVKYPMSGIATIVIAAVALLVAQYLPNFDPFGSEQARLRKIEQRKTEYAKAERPVRQAIAAIDSAPRSVAESEKVQLIYKELISTLEHKTADSPVAAQRSQEALKELEAVKQKIDDAKKFATAQNELANFKDIGVPAPDETGLVAQAHRDIANANLEKAAEELKKAADKLDKMDKAEQDKTVKQMEKLAAEIAKKANDPQVQQQMQQALEKAGMNQQQAQQAAQKMQQAANGNQQAQQQVQQMVNQAIQQANQQAGQGQQQQQQVANALKQAAQAAQQQANGQANAQQMAQAAQGLAQAMKQAAAAQQGQGQGQQGQQQAAGQQAGQGQQGQNAQQQMQQAAQAMQQQIGQLQAMAKDQQAVAAGQQGGQVMQQGQQGQQLAQGQGQGQGQNGQGQQAGGQGKNGQGQWQAGDPQQQQGGQGGQGGAAVAAGGQRPDPTEAPFQVQKELSASQTIDEGKILASSFVKAPSERGTSKVEFSKAIESESKEAADEVEQDRIPRGAKNAVKGYFETLQKSPPSQGK